MIAVKFSKVYCKHLKGKYKVHILTGYSVKEANRPTSAVAIVLSGKQIVIYYMTVCIYTLKHEIFQPCKVRERECCLNTIFILRLFLWGHWTFELWTIGVSGDTIDLQEVTTKLYHILFGHSLKPNKHLQCYVLSSETWEI
jgi:hypothetical protein